jgi:hypothetical protein
MGFLVIDRNGIERIDGGTTADDPWRGMVSGLIDLTKTDKKTKTISLNHGIADGATINTLSLLVVADNLLCLDLLEEEAARAGMEPRDWMAARVAENAQVAEAFVAANPFCAFLQETQAARAKTPVCLKIVDAAFLALSDEKKKAVLGKIDNVLNEEGLAYDSEPYKKDPNIPPGRRFFSGMWVRPGDLRRGLEGFASVYHQQMKLTRT